MSMQAKMSPSEIRFASAILYNVPGWLDRRVLEHFISSMPEVTQVRRQKNSLPYSSYNLVIDYLPETNIFQTLKIVENHPYVTIDHHELYTQVLDKEHPPVSDYTVVSHFKTVTVRDKQTGSVTTARRLKLEKNFTDDGPECYICRGSLGGSFSTPCWSCRGAECHDCIRDQFGTAMNDFERFPARCCETALHPDVAKGILSEAEHAKYRARFEEWTTKQPVYCPVPTCSAFIPSRIAKRKMDRNFTCPVCHTVICSTCKQVSHAEPTCPKGRQDEDVLATMDRLGYKQCPKCGTGVGKLFGCSHVKCKCGAHWCYSCRRRIDVCNIDPCDGTTGYPDEEEPEENDDSQDDHEVEHINTSDSTESKRTELSKIDEDCKSQEHGESSSTDENERLGQVNLIGQDLEAGIYISQGQTVPPVVVMEVAGNAGNVKAEQDSEVQTHEGDTVEVSASPILVTGPAMTQDGAAVNELGTVEPASINLDDPNRLDWENEGLQLGGEPYDDDTMDIWGCIHIFDDLACNRVPRYWMTASIPDWWEREVDERRVECMMCWRPLKLASGLKPREGGDAQMDQDKHKRDREFAKRCCSCGLIVCYACKRETSHT